MGYKQIEINLPTSYSDENIKRKISQKLKIQSFEYSIDKKSLDARKKDQIHWKIRVTVSSNDIKDKFIPDQRKLEIPKLNSNKKVVVVGSGPSGFFSALVLLRAGFDVTIIEQGPNVFERVKAIKIFEKTGKLNDKANYAYGEGGAGTFSDGKLTSRTKSIVLERRFMFDEYIKAGAPEEIRYLSKPHIGSNILVKTARNLRKMFIHEGGKYLFDTELTNIYQSNGKVSSIETNIGKMDCDYLVLGTGHSNFSVFQLLNKSGVLFKTKPFAIGSRVEHVQREINQSQWKCDTLEGVKNAEYSLTSQVGTNSVFTFCMCPGGRIISAPQQNGLNIVNGMSNYKRNSPYANSAIVVALDLNQELKKEVESSEAIDWLYNLEAKFFEYTGGFDAPAVLVKNMMNGRTTSNFPDSSYPFSLQTADFRELFPKSIYGSMTKSFHEFSKKIRGFEDGVMMGLESRTSSPIQALRNKNGLCDGFENLYLVGEGSGFSGGIVSSGADGIKAAMEIIQRNY